MKQAATLIIGLSTLVASQTIIADNFTLAQAIKKAPPVLSKQEPVTTELMYQIMAAEMALNRNQPELALKNYIEVAKKTQDPRIAKRATQIALSLSTLERAQLPAQLWAKNAPKDLEAQITAAAVYIRLGDVDSGVQYLDRLMRLDPIDSDRHFVMLYKQMPTEEDQAVVMDALVQLANQSEDLNLAHVALSDLAIYEDELELAQAYAQQGLAIQPKDPKASILMAQAILQQNKVEQAIAFIDKQLTVVENSLPLRQYYTQLLIEQKMLVKARTQIEILTKEPEIGAQQQLQFARLCMQAGWFDEAQVFLNQARQDSEHRDSAHYFLARLHESKSQPEQAASWYEKVYQGPFHVISFIRAASLYATMDKTHKALEVLKQAQVDNITDYKRVLLAKVDVLNLEKKHHESVALISEYLDKEPLDFDFLYTRAILFDKMNQPKKAIHDLRSIINVDSEHVDGLNALAFILSNHTDKLDEAEELALKANRLSPQNPSIMDTLGWVYFKKGEFDKAKEILTEALELYPDPEIAAHLGEVLWSLDMRTEAKRVWNDALKSSPNDERILSTMERIRGKAKHAN